MCQHGDSPMIEATYPGRTDKLTLKKGDNQMFKLTLRYSRYILSSLATIGFGYSLN